MRSIMRHRIIVVFWIVATVGIGTILWNGSIPKKEYNTLSPIANMPDTPVETPQETGRGSGLSTTDLQNPVESYSISKQAGNGRMPAPCKWWKPSSTLGKLGCGCGVVGSFMVCYLLGIHLVKRRNKKICARFEQYTGFQLLDLGRYNADQRQAFEKALEEDQTILQHKTSPWSSNTFKKANEIHQAICSNQIKKINDTIKSQSTQNQRPVLPAQPFQKIDKSSTDYLGGFWVDVIKVLDEIEEMLTPKTVFSRCTQYFVALCKKHKKTPEERIKDFNHTMQLMHTILEELDELCWSRKALGKLFVEIGRAKQGRRLFLENAHEKCCEKHENRQHNAQRPLPHDKHKEGLQIDQKQVIELKKHLKKITNRIVFQATKRDDKWWAL